MSDTVNKPLPCIVCGFQPESVSHDDDYFWQPSRAVMFDAGSGNFGSTVWDEMSDEHMWINVCDECLVERKDRVAIIQKTRPNPVLTFKLWEGPWTGHEEARDV